MIWMTQTVWRDGVVSSHRVSTLYRTMSFVLDGGLNLVVAIRLIMFTGTKSKLLYVYTQENMFLFFYQIKSHIRDLI